MPKTLEVGRDDCGIRVTFTPTPLTINLSGWYDHFVGIEGARMPLGEFLTRLGITERHVRTALKKVASD